MGSLDQFHAFLDRRVRRDSIQIADLVDAHAQGDADFRIQLALGASGIMSDQEVELRLIAEAAEYDRLGERGVSGGERDGRAAQSVGRVGTAVNCF